MKEKRISVYTIHKEYNFSNQWTSFLTLFQLNAIHFFKTESFPKNFSSLQIIRSSSNKPHHY